jgi:hypothetical protein
LEFGTVGEQVEDVGKSANSNSGLNKEKIRKWTLGFSRLVKVWIFE